MNTTENEVSDPHRNADREKPLREKLDLLEQREALQESEADAMGYHEASKYHGERARILRDAIDALDALDKKSGA